MPTKSTANAETRVSDFDATKFSISVRKEPVETGELFVARAAELPDLVEYAEEFQEAYELMLDSIKTAKEACDLQGLDFPDPAPLSNLSDMPSGKLTLRVARSLHYALSINAKAEGISLNQYVSTLLTHNNSLFEVNAALERLENLSSHFGELISISTQGTTMVHYVDASDPITPTLHKHLIPQRQGGELQSQAHAGGYGYIRTTKDYPEAQMLTVSPQAIIAQHHWDTKHG